MAKSTMDWRSMLAQLEDTLSIYLIKKAPALPANIKDILVAIIPWFTLLGVIFMIPLLLVALGLSAFALPFMAYAEVHQNILWVILSVVAAVLEAMAISGLFNKKRKGWEFLFYAQLVGVISMLFSLSIGGIIGVIVGFYILFQVRSYYK